MRKAMLVAALCLVATLVRAEDAASWPTKPVETTVQWAAGGGADLVFRILAEVFPKYSGGQTMVIKNVPGAAGVTGCVEFLTAPPDGYKLMHWSNAHVTKAQMSVVPYDVNSYEPIIQIVSTANYLVVKADAKWNTLAEFVADAKAKPGEITIGNAGVGGGNHLAALLFEDGVKAEFLHVPFNGGGPAITGLMSGQVDAAMANAPEGMSNVDGKQLKILATFGAQRFSEYPDVPTAKDAGFDLVIEQWRGLSAPKGTPPELIARMHDVLKKCVEDETYVTKVKSMSAIPTYRNTADFTKFCLEEDKRFENLIKSRGFGDRYKK